MSVAVNFIGGRGAQVLYFWLARLFDFIRYALQARVYLVPARRRHFRYLKEKGARRSYAQNYADEEEPGPPTKSISKPGATAYEYYHRASNRETQLGCQRK